MPPFLNTPSPAPCPRCGSVWFAKHEFRQYADQLYSSTVGGSLSPLSNLPQAAHICLCGMLFQSKLFEPRGRRSRLSPDEQSFLESFELAHTYQLQQNQAEERTQKRLRAAAIDPLYLKLLSERIEAAEKLIRDLSENLKGRHLKPRRRMVSG